MDGNRFDDLTMTLAIRSPRRQMLKGLGGTLAVLLGLGAVAPAQAAPCKAPRGRCGRGAQAVCTDLGTDVLNCGACGNSCPAPAHGWATCDGGTCGFACEAGHVACGGACVDLGSDPNNCGTCGHVCGGAMPGCCGGSCVELSADRNNCGHCGVVCPSYGVNQSTCFDGGCVAPHGLLLVR